MPLSAASRLCSACGMCCTGVMFHVVELQPTDSAPDLVALGLRLKRKHGQNYLKQPCPAHQNGGCSIYLSRPERCRDFECRQLTRVASGTITEAMALEKIQEAGRRVAHINKLFEQLGDTNLKRPLTRRFDKVNAEPLHHGLDPEEVALRGELSQAMTELEDLLEADFRTRSLRAESNPALKSELPP